jgi:isocitrate dehydrogenase
MWRCRFIATDPKQGISHTQIIAQLQLLQIQGFDFIKTEHLYNYNNKPGYSFD